MGVGMVMRRGEVVVRKGSGGGTGMPLFMVLLPLVFRAVQGIWEGV
jgi:hypothetical protein